MPDTTSIFNFVSELGLALGVLSPESLQFCVTAANPAGSQWNSVESQQSISGF